VKNPRGKITPTKENHMWIPYLVKMNYGWETLSSMRTTMMNLVRPNLLNPFHRYADSLSTNVLVNA
jgi:hypothetical protein